MAQSKPGARWDDDWRRVFLMDWLCTAPSERDPPSKAKLAAHLGIDIRTIRNWHDRPDFMEEWRRRSAAIVGNPDRARQVMDTLFAAATDPTNKSQVSAAKLYLEATNAIKPPAVELTVKRPIELSDEELDALLASGVQSMREVPEAVETDG